MAHQIDFAGPFAAASRLAVCCCGKYRTSTFSDGSCGRLFTASPAGAGEVTHGCQQT